MQFQGYLFLLQLEYGEDVWRKALEVSECKYTVFNTHQVYPDYIMASLASALAKITTVSYDSFMHFFGKCFVRYFSNFGYDNCPIFCIFNRIYITCFSYDATITATGRYFTDFLNNVDNIHSQFRLSYPKMKSPSMYVTEVDENGCVLVYRSGRHGFTQYLMGKLLLLNCCLLKYVAVKLPYNWQIYF